MQFQPPSMPWALPANLLLILSFPRLAFSFLSAEGAAGWNSAAANKLVALPPLSPALFASSSAGTDTDPGIISGTSSIPGLLTEEEFAYRSSVHRTLQNLQLQLPTTLTVPVDTEAAKHTYAPNCTLVGPKDELLGTDRDEIVSLSQTITTAVGTARNAGRLASSLASRGLNSANGRQSSSEKNDLNLDLVNCEITLDETLSALHVKWKTSLPSANLPARESSSKRESRSSQQKRSASDIIGTSIFTFNDVGIISKHQIVHVEFEGQSIDAVGESLASLRRTVKSVAESSPWVLEAAEAAAPFLADLAELASGSSRSRENDIEISGQSKKKKEPTRAPIFVSNVTISKKSAVNGNFSAIERSRWRIDDYHRNDTAISFPIPGGNDWSRYESIHNVLHSFVKTTIPYLAGDIDPVIFALPEGKSFRDLFTSEVEMKAFDGSLLLSGGGRVSDLYRAASTLREGGGGLNSASINVSDGWKVVDISVNWRDRTATVRWSSDIQIKVEGTDIFYLDEYGQIQLIEQKELIVGGSKIVDASWIRAIIAAVESSRGGATGEILSDVLKRISRRQNPVRSALRKNANKVPPEMTSEAALNFYDIIRTLHAELPVIADVSPGSLPLTPVKAFLSEDIELRGLLDETLARGTRAYKQALSASIGSLRAAIRTGRIKTTKDITPKIEITPLGAIRVSLEISLRIEPPLLPTLTARAKAEKDAEKRNGLSPFPDVGIPLILELVSEYKLDRNGRVIEHSIIMNRINGQKSPADVVSNWIKQESSDDASTSDGTVKQLLDAVQWARSLAGN